MAFEDEVTADAPELWWDTRQASGVSQPDRSGNGHTGTITGGPTLDADGLTFDGSGQWIESANIAAAAYASFALEAVVNPDVLTPYYGSIVTILSPTLPGEMTLSNQEADPGRLTYQGTAADADDIRFAVTDPTLVADVVSGLQHLLIDFDGTDITIYLDGVVYDTNTGAAFDVDLLEGAPVFLGDDFFGGDGYQGLIRHGIFYDHDLGPARAAAHAAAALGDDPPAAGPALGPGGTPSLDLSADFGGGPESITTYGREPDATITRGSSSLLLTGFVADAGTYQTVVDNIDRAFDPNNLSGPFVTAGVSDVVPGVGLTLVAPWDGTDYSLFVGSADGWPQSYPLNGVDQLVDLRGTDAFLLLATASAITSRPPESTGARIQAVLDLIDYPGPTAISPGMSMVPALTLSTVSALSHISDCAQVEFGELYVGADVAGTLTFRDRTDIITDTRSSVSQATFVQQDPTAPYVGLQYSDLTMANLPIINEVVVTYGDTGRQVTVRDAVSIAKPWGLRSFSLSLPFATGSQARGYARWLVLLYANPVTTFSSITLTPANAPGATFDLWEQALSRELGDLITVNLDPLALDVNNRPAPSGDPIIRNCWIRGITHDFGQYPWSTTFYLQDASWLEDLFIWDTSELDGPDHYGL